MGPCLQKSISPQDDSILTGVAVTEATDTEFWPRTQVSPTFREPGCALETFMHAAHAGTAVHWYSIDVMRQTTCTTSILCQCFKHCRSARSAKSLLNHTDIIMPWLPSNAHNIWSTSQVCLSADELEIGGSGAPLLRPLPFQQVQRPRLLICGEEGSGQSHLGPALLYALEGLPVHALGLPSLLSDASARSVLFLITNAVSQLAPY